MNAMDTFLARLADANDNLQAIQDFIDDHMEKDPEKIGYMHAGDAGHLADMLKQVCEAFNLQVYNVHQEAEAKHANA